MNELPLIEAINDISLDALSNPRSDLFKIPKYIGHELLSTTRRAQSIISRSEAELFGTSIPRFAIRVYFDGGGFLNCRRLLTFVRNVHYDNKKEWGQRYEEGYIS